jgi:RNA polymerase sigma factor (sigma-70 family)
MRARQPLKLTGMGLVNGVELDQYGTIVVCEAHAIAKRGGFRTNASELIGPGYEGLRRAAERFDRAKGAFPGFAKLRVRGAMLDYLRGVDIAGRCERARAKVQGREPRRMIDWSSLDEAGQALREPLARPDHESESDLAEILFRPLKPRLRYAARAYFLEDKTLAEVAMEMGTSEAGVCIMVKKAREMIMPYERARLLTG